MYVNYQKYIRSSEWREKSKAAKARAGNRCQVCNGRHSLETHHRTYERLGREFDTDLIVLCNLCHDLFHKNRKLASCQNEVAEDQCEDEDEEYEDVEYEYDKLRDIIDNGWYHDIPKGWYHFQLDMAEEDSGGSFVDIRAVVVSPGGQCGMRIYERLWLVESPKASEQDARAKFFTWAFALGVLTRQEYNAARAAGESCTIDFPSNIGAQFVGEYLSGLHDRVYHITSKEADNAALDMDVVALAERSYDDI